MAKPDTRESIHIDVCPECGEPTTYHPMDPPMQCRHARDRFEPVEFVPAARLREAEKLLRAAYSEPLTWELHERIIAFLEHPLDLWGGC